MEVEMTCSGKRGIMPGENRLPLKERDPHPEWGLLPVRRGSLKRGDLKRGVWK